MRLSSPAPSWFLLSMFIPSPHSLSEWASYPPGILGTSSFLPTQGGWELKEVVNPLVRELAHPWGCLAALAS